MVDHQLKNLQKNKKKPDSNNPTLITSLLMTVLIVAVVFLFVFKYSLVYDAASKGDWGTVAVLELPDILSTLSSSSAMA